MVGILDWKERLQRIFDESTIFGTKEDAWDDFWRNYARPTVKAVTTEDQTTKEPVLIKDQDVLLDTIDRLEEVGNKLALAVHALESKLVG